MLYQLSKILSDLSSTSCATCSLAEKKTMWSNLLVFLLVLIIVVQIFYFFTTDEFLSTCLVVIRNLRSSQETVLVCKVAVSGAFLISSIYHCSWNWKVNFSWKFVSLCRRLCDLVYISSNICIFFKHVSK